MKRNEREKDFAHVVSRVSSKKLVVSRVLREFEIPGYSSCLTETSTTKKLPRRRTLCPKLSNTAQTPLPPPPPSHMEEEETAPSVTLTLSPLDAMAILSLTQSSASSNSSTPAPPQLGYYLGDAQGTIFTAMEELD